MSHSKVAIVTGASRGIGAEIAKSLAKKGVAVLVNYTSNTAAAKKVVNKIEEDGGKAISFQADVSDFEQVVNMFESAENALGKVDILINNAGVMQPGIVKLADTDERLFDDIVSINLKGTFNTLKVAANKLNEGGCIINLSTSVIGLALPGYSIYAATKSGVETMTRIFSKELRGRNITVNSVAPGPTATELFFNGKTEDQVENMAKMAPLERLGTPEDIANTISFLIGSDAGWINGQNVRVNGGIV